MAHAFFLGVDDEPRDGESSHDVTTTLLEKSKEPADDEATYRLDHIRHRTGVSSVEEMADRIQSFVAEQPYIGRTSIIISRSEFGHALLEALDERGLAPVAAMLTGGSGTTAGDPDETGVHLGITDAVQTLANLYRDGRLSLEGPATESASRLARGVQKIAEALDEADGDAEVAGTSNSAPTFDSPDTHVSSAALAAWLGTERSFDPSKHLKEEPQTGSQSTGQQGTA